MDALEPVVFSLEAAAGCMGLIDACPLHLFKHSFGLVQGFLRDMEQPPFGEKADSQGHVDA